MLKSRISGSPAGIAIMVMLAVLLCGGCNLLVDHVLVKGQGTISEIDRLRSDYVTMEFGMFLHFNMSTFARNNCVQCYSVSGEHEQGYEDPNLFRPTQLNCGQWADAAKSAGCRYSVLVTKHHGGFCLWPTDTSYQMTPHCVAQSSWFKENGRRDVVREFVDSMRNRGLEVGFYYSIWDKTNGNALPMIKQQLTELLTNYGPIKCMWFDGWGWMIGYRLVPYDTIKKCVKSIQPNCLIVENNHLHTLDSTDICEYEYPGVDHMVPPNNRLPAEVNTPIRSDNLWFWHPNLECNLKTTGQIVGEIQACHAATATYLLDLTPDTLGLIPQCQVDEMTQIGKQFGSN